MNNVTLSPRPILRGAPMPPAGAKVLGRIFMRDEAAEYELDAIAKACTQHGLHLMGVEYIDTTQHPLRDDAEACITARRERQAHVIEIWASPVEERARRWASCGIMRIGPKVAACHTWQITDADRLHAATVGADPVAAAAALKDWQRGRCAICAKAATCLDHNHATGAVRGWLCSPCNTREGTYNVHHGYVATVYRDYANHPPAVLLGIAAPYVRANVRLAT